jgi:tripartite-type tricarboxylate transporter receptor subunit TctC
MYSSPSGTLKHARKKTVKLVSTHSATLGVKQRLDERSLIVITGKPVEITGYLRTGLEVYGKIVKSAGIQPE